MSLTEPQRDDGQDAVNIAAAVKEAGSIGVRLPQEISRSTHFPPASSPSCVTFLYPAC